jgi:predicted ATPase
LDVPLSLLLDDVQWIDGSSISVLNQILKTSQIKRLFFVASFRDEKENSFVEMVDGLHGWGMAPTKVKLDCLDGTAVNMLLSRMLCLAPRLVLSLSEIVFHKTSGSPLFIMELMQSLITKGLLYVSLTRRRWMWDEEKIQATSLPDNVVSLFVEKISRLDVSVQSSLSLLSCLDGPTDTEIITTIESNLGLTLVNPLEIAVAEGLVSNQKGKYCFCHNRIQGKLSFTTRYPVKY